MNPVACSVLNPVAVWLFRIRDFESIKSNFESVLRTIPEDRGEVADDGAVHRRAK
jgi:hypothetical protein